MSKTPFFCILAKKSPGLVKEVDCLSKLVSTIVDAEIESFPLTKISVFSALNMLIGQRLRGVKNCRVVWYNASPFLVLAAPIIRFMLGYQQCIALHEPGMDNKLNYGASQATKIVVFEFAIWFLCRIMNKGIVFSKNAQRTAVKRGLFSNKDLYLINLRPALNHFYPRPESKQNRVVFIGVVHKAKMFEKLLLAIELADRLKSDIRFSILSRKIPDNFHQRLSNLENVDLVSQATISDKQIWNELVSSKVAIKLDRNMTQSGIMAQCFFTDILCVANDIPGFQEFIDDGINGFLLDSEVVTETELLNLLELACAKYEFLWPELRQIGKTYIEENDAQINQFALDFIC